jgi:hypothetical protein
MKRFIPILAGLVVCGIGVFILFVTDEKEKKCTISTRATVYDVEVSHETDADGNWVDVYKSTFKYRVGEEYYLNSPKTSSNHEYTKGETVDIKYNPNNPNEFIIKGDYSDKFGGFMVIGVGSIFIIVGIISLFPKKNKQQVQPTVNVYINR